MHQGVAHGDRGTRYFQAERGLKGQLLLQLSRRLHLLDCDIVEQEYQKRHRNHGLTVRPDIIVHEPFDSHRRTHGGYRAVVELE